MSKSFSYALPILEEKGYSKDQIRERSSELLFDRIMNGGRSNVVKAPFGAIKVTFCFDKDGSFDCAQSFRVEGEEAEDIDELLKNAAYTTLCDKQFRVSSQEDVDHLQNGDLLELTIGNFIVGERTVDNVHEINIILPTTHKVVKGGL